MKEVVKQGIMNDFWSRTLKRVTTFPGCDPSLGNKLHHFNSPMLVSACHITVGNEKVKISLMYYPMRTRRPGALL